MSISRKILSLTIALLMLLACFASCAEGGDDQQTTSQTTVQNEEAPSESAEIYFDLVDASGNPCYVVYPDGASEKIIDLANKTATRLRTKIGMKVPSVICETELTTNQGNYIYVGKVNATEVNSLLSELRYSDAGYKVYSQNLICITGHCDDSVEDSCKLFWDTFNKDIIDRKPLSNGTEESGGYYYPASAAQKKEGSYNISSLTIDGTDISDYKIIYATDAQKDAALKLKDSIGKATGNILTVAPSSDTEIANEILIGNTNRAMSKKYEATAMHNYQIAIESSKLAVVAPHELMMEQAIDYLVKTILEAKGETSALELTAKDNVLGTTTKESFDLLAKDDGDIRILSTNLYFENQTRERAATYLNILPLYNADFLCIQEMDSIWHLLLDNEIPKLGYTAVPTVGEGEYANKKHADNFTPIYYRADKYKLVVGGYQPFSSVKDTKENVFVKYPELAKLNDTQKQNVLNEYVKNGVTYGCVGHLSKSFSWAVFESLESGERFCVISTHMTHDNSATIANVRRMYDVKEVLAKKDAIAAEYDIPVMILGDFNFNSTTTPYSLMKNGGMIESYSSCEVRESFYTGHTLGVMPNSFGGNPIDMCFHTEGIDANKTQIIVNEHTAFYSDHFPITFDFSIN